jgi:hypothetical protein
LSEAFLALSRTAVLESGVEAVTVAISGLTPTVTSQLALFAPTSGQAQQRDLALERLRTRYAGSFVQARFADPTAQVPEQRVRFESWEIV